MRGILVLVGGGIGVLFAILLARRNWKTGRTDPNGAGRLALAVFLLSMVSWMGSVHPIANDTAIQLFIESASSWLMAAATVWVLYLALEPSVRSRWPHSIVTWNRVLTGRWLDAQVGSHILIDAAAGSSLWLVFCLLEEWLDSSGKLSSGGSLFFTQGTRQWIGGHAQLVTQAIYMGLIGFFAIFGLRRLLRNDLLAAAVASILFAMMEGNVVNSADWHWKAAIYVLVYGLLIFVLLRLGLLATLSGIVFANSIGSLTLGTDWKTWYAPSGIATMLLLATVAAFAFWRSLGSRDLLDKSNTA